MKQSDFLGFLKFYTDLSFSFMNHDHPPFIHLSFGTPGRDTARDTAQDTAG